MTPSWYEPYAGLPVIVEILFYFVLVLTLASIVSTVVLSIGAIRVRHRRLPAGREQDFLWVFVVPALNEEVTIADSVGRLQAVQATHKMMLVIDDGSDDGTAEILAGIDDPDLTVLTRIPPAARQGKAAALNAAWRHLHGELRREELSRFTPEQVLLVVVDADGRLSPQAPVHIARHFADPAMAGVQSLVRIYNRRGWLTWAQDVEFGVFGQVFQLGRSRWGTANMGGNGQSNRLAALDAVADHEGPWRHRLTEDQDIGVRLLQSGWKGAQDTESTVEQQGLNSLRRLYRQRTRWAQGAFEAIGLIGGTRRVKVSAPARLDLAYYLLTPIIQLVVGVGLVAAICLAIWADLPFWAGAWPMLVFYLTLSFGPGLVGLASRGEGLRGLLTTIVCVLPYTLYSWLTFPVLLRALYRHLTGRATWSKTAREPIENDEIDVELPPDHPARTTA